MRFITLILIFIVTIHNNYSKQISSPDSNLTLTIKLSDSDKLIYNLIREWKIVVKDSKLGIDLFDEPDLLSGFKINTIVTSNYFEGWSPLWGEVDKKNNNYFRT